MYFKRLLRDYEFKKSALQSTKDKIIQHYIDVIEKETEFELDEIQKEFETTAIYFTNEDYYSDNYLGVIFIEIDNTDMSIYSFDILGEVHTDLNLEKIKELIER